ncbi:MAG: kelch repeat-containing protein, partial [Flavobacteriales bacterium]|nr:kelch repeat-containing protein [Flavobacteriales bacterium]
TNNAVCEGFINNQPYVYSFAGLDDSKLPSGIHLRSFKYDVNNDIWSSIPDLPDTMGKIAAAATYINGIIYIIGGYHVFDNGHEVSSNKVHRFDVNTNAFLSDGANIPTAIDDQVQVLWRDSLIFVISGWSNTTNVPDVQIYNPYHDTWSTGTPVPATGAYMAFGASGNIIGDTIYYFGGARMGSAFPIQNTMRKGIIDPNDPTQIIWSNSVIDSQINGYRMGSFEHAGSVFWIGGSAVTYNYNGVAYNGTGGVPPLKRQLSFNPSNSNYEINDLLEVPMDLRGVARVNANTFYTAGGMLDNQTVTNKTHKIAWTWPSNTQELEKRCIDHLSINNKRIPINHYCSEKYTLKVIDLLGREIENKNDLTFSENIQISMKGAVILILSSKSDRFQLKTTIF